MSYFLKSLQKSFINFLNIVKIDLKFKQNLEK